MTWQTDATAAGLAINDDYLLHRGLVPFDNSKNRETVIWNPFLYYGSYSIFQDTERRVIFGLYSNSHLNNDKYIAETESISLSQILVDYNSKIAELDVDSQKLVMDITAKRYIAGIETLIHDEKMITRRQGINADDDMWTAKFGALAADRAALLVLQSKITTETLRITNKILELQAYINIEIAQLSLVDIEIAEKSIVKLNKDLELVAKEVQLSRKEVELLQVANEIVQVQLKIVEAGLEIVNVDVQVSKTKIQVAQIENQISKADLTNGELTIAQAHVTAEQADLLTYEAKRLLAVQKLAVKSTEKIVAQSELDLMPEKIRIANSKLTVQDSEITVATEELDTFTLKLDLEDSKLTSLGKQITIESEEVNIVKSKVALAATKTAVAKEKVTVEKASLLLFDKQIALETVKTTAVTGETTALTKALITDAQINTAKEQEESTRHVMQLNDLAHRTEMILFNTEERQVAIDLQKTIWDAQLPMLTGIDEQRAKPAYAGATAQSILTQAHISAAATIAGAAIASELTHTIRKA